VNAAPSEIEVFDGFPLFARAKNDGERRLFVRLSIMPVEPAQIELHLARIGRLELTELELDDDQAAQLSMEEEQVDVVVVAVERDALLPLHEGEARAQLQEKPLDLPQQGRLQILLAVGVFQPEEIEQIRVLQHEVRR